MSTNNTFSFARLALVMKRDFMENWKTNLYRFLGPYASFLLVMWVSSMNESNSFNDFADNVSIAFFSVLFFGGSFTASYIMESMNTQQKRTSYLMLPATMLEKFLSRFLYVTAGFAIMTTLGLLLAEATRFMLMPFLDCADAFKQSVLSDVFQTMTHVRTFNFNGCGTLESIAGWLFLIWSHSFFLLGGCRWYKHAFWKTLGCFILVELFLVIFVANYVTSLDENTMLAIGEWCQQHLSWVTSTGLATFKIGVLSLLILLNWWLSYRCFTRQQVIEPKFRLL